ncbi:MAG TPA: hypothetical protein VHM02_06885 [Thermoanaerobaculia bacterium]|nr:hypothetical protein [Thermoanaerobaculia bacterium]
MSDEPKERAFVAFDWSGAEKAYEEAIWMALVQQGRLQRLENGFQRARVADELIQVEKEHGRLTVGFDFAFSFPEWFVRRQGAASGPEFWTIAEQRLEVWIGGETLQPPFHLGRWGDGTCAEFARFPNKRATDPAEADSCFHLQGPKQVGRGALRGFAVLRKLEQSGFKIWPFDPPSVSSSLVIEIYPRRLYEEPRVSKGKWRERVRYLKEHHPKQDPAMLERAAGSDHAFDAAVSALRMAGCASELDSLREGEPHEKIEGRIWRPAG